MSLFGQTEKNVKDGLDILEFLLLQIIFLYDADY